MGAKAWKAQVVRRSRVVGFTLLVSLAAAATPLPAIWPGDAEIKNLLLLMEKDRSGKVSIAEFMSFMQEEFRRLDANNGGQLDVREPEDIQVRPVLTYPGGGSK